MVLGLWLPLPEATKVAEGGAEVLSVADGAQVTAVVADWHATVTVLATGLLHPVKLELRACAQTLKVGLAVVRKDTVVVLEPVTGPPFGLDEVKLTVPGVTL
jgi:hypothetical protein